MNYDEIIKKYALAYREAEKGRELMLKGLQKHCLVTMYLLGKAEEAIFSLEDFEKAPKVLVDFIKASKDRGCMECGFSGKIGSDLGKKHKKCVVKINRFFKIRDKLVEYGESLV